MSEQHGETKGRAPRYTLRPVSTPITETIDGSAPAQKQADPFIRPATEDDDGYDPFSDRPPAPEPAYQEDPWR